MSRDFSPSQTYVLSVHRSFGLSNRLNWLEQVIRRLFTLRPLRRWQEGALTFHADLSKATALMARRPVWVHLPLAALTALQHGSNYLTLIASSVREKQGQ